MKTTSIPRALKQYQVGNCSVELKGRRRPLSLLEEVLLYIGLSYLGWCLIYGFGITRGWW